MIELTLLPFILGLLATVILTFITLPLIKRAGLIDDPKKHIHPGIIHTKPTPRGGGIPFFGGILLVSLFLLPLSPQLISIFIAGLLALIVGVIDDKFNALSKDVSPYLRFLVNILCAVIVVGSGVSISFITNPLGGILDLNTFLIPFIGRPVGDIVAGLWIIWVMNMLNWSKGVDGQMPGVVAISALVIGILSLRFADGGAGLVDAKLSFIIAGSAIGFLLFNFYPAKLFPGYGATSVYMLLAVVSILSGAKLATAILVMGVPIVDAVFTIIRRLLNKKSPFQGDKRHLHHIFLRLGYTQRQISLAYWSFSALLGTVALTLESRSKLYALVMLVVLVTGGLLFLHFMLRLNHEKDAS